MAEEETTDSAEPEVPSWSSIAELAADGALLLEDGIAYTCATMCAELMEVLHGLGTEGLMDGASSVTASVPPSVHSLGALDTKLTRLGTDLAHAIGSAGATGTYLDGLNNMLETFKEAGKKYQEAEDISSSEFDLDNVRPSTATIVSLLPHSGAVHSKEFLMDRLENMEMSSPVELWADFPEGMGYDDLWSLGDYIRTYGLSGLYESLGTKWYRFGDTLNTAAGDFMNSLIGSTADTWEGEGKAAAVLASENYSKQLKSLVEAMWRVGDAYRYASLWLDETQKVMPQGPDNMAGTYSTSGSAASEYPYLDTRTLDDEYSWEEKLLWESDANGFHTDTIVIVEDPTPVYRENYRNTYLAGITDTAQYFPVIPSYITESGSLPPSEETSSSDPGAGGGTYGNGAETPYGGTGGYSPAPLDSATAESTLERLAPVGADGTDPYSEAWEQMQQESDRWQAEQQGMQAVQQGLTAAQQAVQDALGVAREMSNTDLPGAVPTGGLPFPRDEDRPAGLAGMKSRGPGGGITAGANGPGAVGNETKVPRMDTSKLFPRAGISGMAPTATGMAGPAANGAPMGMPMTPGAGAPGARGGRDEGKHERAKYLDRADNMDEALGGPMDMTWPVVGETGARQTPEQAPPPGRPQRPPTPQQPQPQPQPQPRQPEQRPVIVQRPGGN
ncbi:hypothetical protein [Nocardia paucivorans]|uniref:hypothetical protein n=1 Tax=Nocardia paucivorans TaxID=114259 RepID=UPI0002DDC324|nr:hypothetical protein [Nocardia paucivorans]